MGLKQFGNWAKKSLFLAPPTHKKGEGIDPAFLEKAAGYEADLRKGGYDPATADNYFNQADTNITAAQNQAGESSAESYARRGLGSSGMAASAGADVTLQAAAARATARQRAIDAATSNKRSSTLDAWGVAAKAKGMDMEYQKWLALKQANEDEKYLQAMRDLTSIGGFAAGGA
jgi:hypothetical protein